MKTLSILWLSCLFLVSTSTAAEDWRAGVGRMKITPTQRMPMAGYAGRGANHATGTLEGQDLWAKALVLKASEEQTCVLVTLDLVGLDRELSDRICSVLQTEFKLDRAGIILSTSHTHSGPVVAGNLRPMHAGIFDKANQDLVLEYAKQLEQNILAAVQQAFQDLSVVTLRWASGKATFAVNRRNNPEAEVVTRRQENQLIGPIDHSVPTLGVYRDDRVAVIVFGYACHNTTLNGMEWSGDYAGFAQTALEEMIPGCTAMYWAGCGGDQNPVPRRQVELAKNYGKQLALAAKEALTDSPETVQPSLQTRYQEVPLPFAEIPKIDHWQAESTSTNPYIAGRAKSILDQLQRGDALATEYPYPISYWKLGNQIHWFALGGEVVVDYSLRIKELLHGVSKEDASTWVMAYANDVMAYIPSRRVLAEGGYEGGGAMVYYGLPTAWSAEVETVILNAVTALYQTP